MNLSSDEERRLICRGVKSYAPTTMCNIKSLDLGRSIIEYSGYDRKAKGRKLEARITIDELKKTDLSSICPD